MNTRVVRRWLMRMGRVSVCVLVLASGQEASTQERSETDLFNAPVEFRCADNQRALKPTGYFLALHSGHPDSIRDAASRVAEPGDPLAPLANIVVYVSADSAVMPLTLRLQQAGSYVYSVNCQSQLAPSGNPDDFPTLLIKLNTVEDKVDLIKLLEQQMEEAVSNGSLASLLFSGNSPETALISLPDPGQKGMTYGDLVSVYFNRRQEALFLDSFPGSASIESLEPGNRIVSLRRIASRTRVAETGDRESKATQSTSDIVGGPLEQRQKRKIQVRLANRSLAAMDLLQPGTVETFGYCSGIKRDSTAAGAYVFDDCVTDERRQVPIRIRGFEPITLELGNQAIRLDPLLKSRAYGVPYPANWRGAATDRAEVLGGPVEDVLKRPVTLRQFGLPGCEVAVALTVADVVGATLSFPEPPCGTVDLSLPREMFGKSAPVVVEGCQPGSNAPLTALADGRVRCVMAAGDMKAGAKKVRLSWAAGFDPVEFDLPTNRGGKFKLAAADLSKDLRASIPRQDGTEHEPIAPIHRSSEVRYLVGGHGCGKGALPLVRGGAAPSVAEAGCKRLPDRMELTFEIDQEKSDPSIPLDAFRGRIVQTVALGSTQSANARVEPNSARVKLPIDFNAERKLRYTSQYAQAAELLVAGARIYGRPNCSNQGGQPIVKLFTKREKNVDFQWPVYGQVSDNEGRPLTNCAKSIVERDGAGRPYLTFEFISTRAVGPRRTIVLARSQDLMDKPGMPKALDSAFIRFVRTAHEWHKQGAALSPVDVLSVSQDGAMRRVFTGEEAALQSQAVEASIAQLDRTAPKTPDLSLLRLQPETKGADRVLIIMDGSSATTRQVSKLRLLGSDLAARRGEAACSSSCRAIAARSGNPTKSSTPLR